MKKDPLPLLIFFQNRMYFLPFLFIPTSFGPPFIPRFVHLQLQMTLLFFFHLLSIQRNHVFQMSFSYFTLFIMLYHNVSFHVLCLFPF